MYGANSSIHILMDVYRKQIFLKKFHILKISCFSIMSITLIPVHVSPVYLLGIRTCRDICICVNIYTYVCVIDMYKYIFSCNFSAWFIVCSNSVHKVPLTD